MDYVLVISVKTFIVDTTIMGKQALPVIMDNLSQEPFNKRINTGMKASHGHTHTNTDW